MKSRYTSVLILLMALLAFMPVVGVDYFLDGYVRNQETARLQNLLDYITEDTELAVDEALETVRGVVAESPSLCTPTFLRNVHARLRSGLYVRQVLVEGAGGAQYCNAFEGELVHAPLSQPMPLPGRVETISIVRMDGWDMPAIKVTQTQGGRAVSALVHLNPHLAGGMPDALSGATMLELVLTDGTRVASLGDPAGYERRASGSAFLVASSFVGDLPLRAQVAVPFAAARAGYADLDVTFTVIACLISAAFFSWALYYVRRSQLPAFDLERAIAQGELRPHYQPVINLKTGRLAGCEVLIRWEKRNGQIIPPGVFIDYAEVTGLALPMTLSLMQQVRADLSGLCAQMPELKVSINLFEGHFRQGSIVEDVQAIFGDSPIGFRQLVFEITERRPLEDSAQVNSVIAGLHALGSRLAMDDAGTGHSNLAYMQTLGVDVIKIDRVFVDMVKTGDEQVPVLDGLIAMARDLGTEIIAEGVETPVQAVYLRDRGVHLAQGFLFAPALRPAAFIELAQALNAAPAAVEATAVRQAA